MHNSIDSFFRYPDGGQDIQGKTPHFIASGERKFDLSMGTNWFSLVKSDHDDDAETASAAAFCCCPARSGSRRRVVAVDDDRSCRRLLLLAGIEGGCCRTSMWRERWSRAA